jgi:uncharacterized RDD family membrane protein YckC
MPDPDPDPSAGQPSFPPPPAGNPFQPPVPGQQFQPAPPIPAGYGYGQVAPGGVPAGMYFDPQSGLTLPNGVTLANPGRRIGAYFLAIPLLVVTLGIGYIIWGLIAWRRGQSPALQVLGMRCWRPETNSVAGFGRMALRDIVGRIADGILSIITELISFILMLSSPRRQSLHDLIGGTVVLHDPNKVLAG